MLVHDLVPARFNCPRGVFLVNQGRWFKHMHDRDGGPSDTSTVAGSMRPIRNDRQSRPLRVRGRWASGHAAQSS